jgi:hypothetical protein
MYATPSTRTPMIGPLNHGFSMNARSMVSNCQNSVAETRATPATNTVMRVK